MNKNYKEIEYQSWIKNGESIIKELNFKYIPTILNLTQYIFKKNGSKYFARIAIFKQKQKKDVFLTLKDDLLSLKKEKNNSIKIGKEVEVEIKYEDINKYIEIIKMFGFNKVHERHIKKYKYEIDNLIVTLDFNKEGDCHFEIEGDEKSKIINFKQSLNLIIDNEK
jgi:adenylate cyclase class IV